MWDVIRVIAPQVDQMFVVLNEYEEIPEQFDAYPNVTAVIPDRDVKDAGKFWFQPAPDDIVFTVDDDITYPSNYVEVTLDRASVAGLEKYSVGYFAFYWKYKKRLQKYGWKDFHFHRPCPGLFFVDVLGTGTACILGKNMPDFDYIAPYAGFVDLGVRRWNSEYGIQALTLPREENELRPNLPASLKETSLFHTVNKKPVGLQKVAWDEVRRKPFVNAGRRFRSEDKAQSVCMSPL